MKRMTDIFSKKIAKTAKQTNIIFSNVEKLIFIIKKRTDKNKLFMLWGISQPNEKHQQQRQQQLQQQLTNHQKSKLGS